MKRKPSLYVFTALLLCLCMIGSCSPRRSRRVSDKAEASRAYQGSPLAVNFYLERSGSMIPYDAPSGDGSFKSSIVSLLNALPGNKAHLYIVNSQISRYPDGVERFLTDGNIFESTRGLGDPSYTDFASIFDRLLNRTDTALSVLVTDLVYSAKQMDRISSAKVFSEINGMIHSVFKSDVNGKSVLVVKMRGSYDGLYYPFDSSRKGVRYRGYRPYYIVVVGRNEDILRLSADPAYRSFSSFEELAGYSDSYLFTAKTLYHPPYTLLLRHPMIVGRFRPQRDESGMITGASDMEATSSGLRLVVAADLSQTLLSSKMLGDVRSYRVLSDDGFRLERVIPIRKNDLSPVERKMIPGATHLFVVSAPHVSMSQDIRIELKNELPSWVDASSTDDDRDVSAPDFSSRTFALRYLMRGIYDSYTKSSQNDGAYFSLKIHLNP